MVTAFLKARVFVGDGRVLDRASVLVDGERIVKVAEGEIKPPRGASRIDMAGRTLLPGFIDCHVHLCLAGQADSTNMARRERLPLMTLEAARSARRTLQAGVTTVRDMGGFEYLDLALREAVRSGLIPGPRILASGRLICMTGGTAWMFGGREADGPDEVRKAAREQIKAGADVVKLMATGGILTPGVEPGCSQFTEEELRAGVEEAHKAGRRTASHAQGTQGVLNALRAGIDSIEHGIFLDEEAVALMVRQDAALVPTLSPLYNILEMGVEHGVPQFAVDKTVRVKPAHLASVRLAHEAGVKVALGTDAGTPFNYHGRNLREVELLVENGFSPAEAIRAGTGLAAAVLGLERELGTIEEGKLADLVVVEGDPLSEVSLLTRAEAIGLVMQGGRVVEGNHRD